MTTINDVAKRAQVAKSTVSHVFTGKKKISKELTERVLQAAEALNYKPNYYAKTLASKNSRVIGVSFNVETSYASSDFNQNIIKGILSVCETRGYYLLVKPNFQFTTSFFPLDGEIFLNPDDENNYEETQNHIWIGNPPSKTNDKENYVDNDNEYIGYMVTEYLAKKSHQKIAFLNSGRNRTVSHRRKEGHEAAISRYGLESNDQYHWFLDNDKGIQERTYEYTLKLLQHHNIDAFIVDSDKMAQAVYQVCHQLNLQIAKDISIIAICSSASTSDAFHPQLTTVELNEFELGKRAAGALVSMIDHNELDGCNRIVATKIIERESVCDKWKGKKESYDELSQNGKY